MLDYGNHNFMVLWLWCVVFVQCLWKVWSMKTVSGSYLNMKILSYQYKDSNYKDKTYNFIFFLPLRLWNVPWTASPQWTVYGRRMPYRNCSYWHLTTSSCMLRSSLSRQIPRPPSLTSSCWMPRVNCSHYESCWLPMRPSGEGWAYAVNLLI